MLAGKKLLALAFAGLLILPALASQKAFADGLFQENIQGNIAGRDVNLFVRVNPPILTTETAGDRFMQVRLFEGNNETIKYSTFIIEISKVTGSGEDTIMSSNAFHTESGLLTLKIQPQEGDVDVQATVDDFLQAYKADPGGTINIKGPILLDGGLYHFRIDVIGVDNVRALLPPDQIRTFDTYLSVGDVVTENVQYQGQNYPTTLISYYDKVQDLAFDPDSLTYSWSMPFNWDVERIKSATSIFVHEEIRIPKSFAGVGDVTAFDATVNGKPVVTRMLSVDPFSSQEDLTLHFLINRNDILSLAADVPDNADTMQFAFSPASDGGVKTSGEITTDTGGMLVLLDWEPNQLSAESQTTLGLEFHDAFSGERMDDDVTYDLRIIAPDGSEVYSQENQVAEGGSDSQTLTFPADETYTVELEVKGVTRDGQSPDMTRNGIARGTVIVPEFPVGAMLAVIGALGSLVAYQRLARKP
ncbi:MAG: hypothetical protein QXJ74_10825 [Nitrososphaera sp.]